MIKQRTYIGNVIGTEATLSLYRTIIAFVLGVSIMAMIVFLGGCSCHERLGSMEGYAYDYPPAVSPKLLLRSPAERSMDPQAFAYRSDWPAVTGDTPLGRVTFSRETWYNYQSLTPGVSDYSYNLFQMYRYGTSTR